MWALLPARHCPHLSNSELTYLAQLLSKFVFTIRALYPANTDSTLAYRYSQFLGMPLLMKPSNSDLHSNSQGKKVYDFIVVGGGILGMSTAWQLQKKYPEKTVLVLEKESGAAQHQTGHNSGVIHAGVYYKPGSLKARFCKEGNKATKQFCQDHEIPFDECGKLLVATNAKELERMQA